jgi:hypothetical protein
VTVQGKQQGRFGNFVYVKAGLYFRLFLMKPYPNLERRKNHTVWTSYHGEVKTKNQS